MTTKELQELLDNYQAGKQAVIEQDSTESIEPLKIDEDMYGESEPVQPVSLYRRFKNAAASTAAVSNDYTEEAVEAGYGTSKYDTSYSPGMDLEQNRALEQGWFSKVGTGLTKGGITALATAANATAGVVWGTGSALFDLAFDLNGDGRGFMKSLDAGVNNWVSEKLTELQNWSEEVLPNYRTQEERSEQYQREWIKHMHTGNFVGDSILKNFGFTVGAMGGGAAWTKLIGRVMTARMAGDVLKGAVAAANGGDAAASAELARAAEAIRRGTAVAVDGQKLSANLQRTARSLNRAEARLQIYGATISAMGEGTTEGLMAKNEFLEDYNRRLDEKRAADLAAAEAQIYESGDRRYVDNRLQLQPDGSLVETPVLTEEGQRELELTKRQIDEKYEKVKDFAEQEGQRLAATTYLLNQLILIPSHHIQFARLFSGGWKTSRSLNSAVRGRMTMVDGKPVADYAGKGHRAGRTILKSLKVAGTEAAEEMLQGTASSGTKEVANARLTAFNDSGYDEEAIRSVRGWFEQMFTGGTEYLSDFKNWQEGALGALTGLFGIPGRRWHGGIAEAYRDAKDEVKASKEAADKLNTLVNSRDFQDRWHGYIRHLKYDNDMEAALRNDNQYAWHTADDEQMISDIVTFAKAGRLEDLNQLVTHYGSIKESEADSIREVLGGNDGETADWARNASDKDIVERVKKQADRMHTTIQEYRDVYDALKSRVPQGTNESVIDELVFTAQQIKAIDRRFLQMFGETMNEIDPILESMSMLNEDGSVATQEESAQRLKKLRDTYERIFAGSLVPLAMPEKVQKAIDNNLDVLKEAMVKAGLDATKVSDMMKLSENRKDFYQKLRTLQTDEGIEQHEEQAATQERVEEAAEEAAIRQETNELDTLDKVKESYFKVIHARERAQYADDLRRVEDSNPSVKKFLEIKRKHDAFRRYIENNPITSPDITVNYAMTSGLVDDLLRNAKNPEDLDTLPDYLFPSEENFDSRNTSILGLKSPTAYKNAIEAVKKSMREFLQLESDTATRKTLGAKPLEFTPEPGTVSEPTGRDASQPGSLVPNPPAQPKKKPASEEKKSADYPEEVSVAFTGDAGDSRTAVFLISKENGSVYAEHKIGTNPLRVPLADLYDAGFDENNFGIEGFDYDADEKIGLEEVYIRPDDTVSASGNIAGKVFRIEGKENVVKLLNAIAPEIVKALRLDVAQENRSAEDEAPKDGDTAVEDNNYISAGIAETAAYEDVPQGMQDERATPNGTHYQIPYYRTSVPEIDTGEAKKARAALSNNYWEARSRADLSDFVLSHPEYAPIWNALDERGAFRYAATKLRVGDEILLAIDPKFPKYQGENQILICARDSEGRLQVLNTLSYQGNKYYGLNALRDTIRREYDTFSSGNPNDVFVFGKKSRVWGLRGGLIDYDYSGKTENSVSQLPGYDEGSVVFLSRELNPITVVGDDSLINDNMGVLNKVITASQATDKAGKNNKSDKKTRKGTLYFLSPTGSGAVPIALNVRHFNEESMDTDTPTFQRIRESVSRIADIVRETPTYSRPIEREFENVVDEPVLDSEGNPVMGEDGKEMTTSSTVKVTRMERQEEADARYKELVSEQNRKLHEELRTLRQDLDIHNWFFNIEDVEMHNEDGTVAGKQTVLRVNNGAAAEEAGEQQKSYLIRPDQSSKGQMMKFFAKLDCAVDVRLPSKNKDNTGERDSDNKTVEDKAKILEAFKQKVSNLFNEGILTTNARKLQPKGTDFYFDAWDDSHKEFRPLTTAQMMLREEQDRREVEEQQIMDDDDVPVIPPDAESVEEVQKKDENNGKDSSDVVEGMTKPTVGRSRQAAQRHTKPTSQQESRDKSTEEAGQTEQKRQESAMEQMYTDQSIAEMALKTFSEQPELIKHWILRQMTEETFDSLSVTEREQTLRCL